MSERNIRHVSGRADLEAAEGAPREVAGGDPEVDAGECQWVNTNKANIAGCGRT